MLFTTPVNHRIQNRITCVIANVSGKTLDVTIELINESGTVVPTFPVNAMLAPGPVAKGFASQNIGGPFAYCKFTLANGSDKGVRAGYCLAEVPADESELACFATGDAR